MKQNILLSKSSKWTLLQKIAFRFFFVFLILQEIFTEGIYIISFGNNRDILLRIYRLNEKIFTGPCIWFNDHIFHFTYIPLSYTTFSASLRSTRDIMYLFITCAACGIWTMLDRKRDNYNQLFYWFSRCQVIFLSFIVFSYGIIKLFPVQMRFPTFTDLNTAIGELSPIELLWVTFGYGSPYEIFCGFFEVLGAILILFNRTRMAGLLIISAVMTNVIVINYTYQIGVTLFSIYILLSALFLLAPYTASLLRFFFNAELAAPVHDKYRPTRNFKLLKIGSLLLLGVFFLSQTYNASKRYTNQIAANESARYSLVKNFIVNDDTLKPVENDVIRWRFWGEKVVNGKRSLTVTTMKPGADKKYSIEQDSTKRILMLRPADPRDSVILNFSYANRDSVNWHLEGMIQQDRIKIELQRINPDTIMKLLKGKRTILPVDE